MEKAQKAIGIGKIGRSGKDLRDGCLPILRKSPVGSMSHPGCTHDGCDPLNPFAIKQSLSHPGCTHSGCDSLNPFDIRQSLGNTSFAQDKHSPVVDAFRRYISHTPVILRK